MLGQTPLPLLCIMTMLRPWNLPLLGALQLLEGMVLTILRREIEVFEAKASFRTTIQVQPSDLAKTPTCVERPGSLWPMILLAVGCWALVAVLLHKVGLI